MSEATDVGRYLLKLLEKRKTDRAEQEAADLQPFVDALCRCFEHWINDANPAAVPVRIVADVLGSEKLSEDWAKIITRTGTFFVQRTIYGWDICCLTHCPKCKASELPSGPLGNLEDVIAATVKDPAPISTHRCY